MNYKTRDRILSQPTVSDCSASYISRSDRAVARQCYDVAWDWICRKYDLHNVAGPKWYGTPGKGKPLFFPSSLAIRLPLGSRSWRTYSFKRLGVEAWCPADQRQSYTLAFIHEMTHFITAAYGKGRSGELEPTSNEIEFCRASYPELAAMIHPIEGPPSDKDRPDLIAKLQAEVRLLEGIRETLPARINILNLQIRELEQMEVNYERCKV